MKLALLGNPNTGKSSIFNLLTGLNQHIGNFPGVTVDKKVGKIKTTTEQHILTDFPGTYSIYPKSADEEVVYDGLITDKHQDLPNALICVADVTNLKRNLLFFSQLYDLGFPILLVLNMTDIAKRKGIKYDVNKLQSSFPETKIVETTARVGLGKDRVLAAIEALPKRSGHQFLAGWKIANKLDVQTQELETERRFEKINALLSDVLEVTALKNSFSNKLDKVLVHPVFGYLIFAAVLIVIFQMIYSFATIPMDWIDGGFGYLAHWTENTLPSGMFNDLLTQGIIPGLGGVIIFIPQIALLFAFIGVLEQSGYLSRVVFIMDRVMRPLGLNGKSIVPLLSGVACAIPGVMAARTISDRKERLITILVVPLMSCSARIPVYTLLISLVIPQKIVGGIFELQGLALFGLYTLGTVSAIVVAVILKLLIKTKEKGFLILEMPSYKLPSPKNIMFSVYEKVKVFVFEAGKIILAISIVLWALSRFGPDGARNKAMAEVNAIKSSQLLTKKELSKIESSKLIESSYIGILGKTVEPVIAPLGYDWKMGIALITSFAAREVFVGSLATIYSVEDGGDNQTPLLEKMRNDTNASGAKVFNLGTGLSLMVFYAFAMQCMATLAIVKRETKSWKWPLYQLAFMGAMAYFGALIVKMIF